MNDEQKAKAIEQFLRQRDEFVAGAANRAYEARMVNNAGLMALFNKAKKGDQRARMMCEAFTAWCHEAEGPGRGCFSCDCTLKKQELGLIVFVTPMDGNGLSIVSVMCDDCSKKLKSPNDAWGKLIETLEEWLPGLKLNQVN